MPWGLKLPEIVVWLGFGSLMIHTIRLATATSNEVVPVAKVFHMELFNMDAKVLATVLPSIGWKVDEFLTDNNGMGFTVYMRPAAEGTYRCWVK